MTGLLILATMAQLSQFVTYISAGIRRHFCVAQMSDGGYVCSGNLVATGFRPVLCRFDSNGNLLWYYYLYKTANEDPGGQSFVETYDGGFVLTGQLDNLSATDVALAKFNSAGGFSWIREISLGWDWAYSIIESSDNGLVIAGATDTDILLTKFDASGNHLWTKSFSGSGTEVGRGVTETSDGGLALVGFTNSWGAGGYDIVLMRLNSTGDTLWTRTLGGTGDDLGYSLVQTTDGGFVVSGYTESFGAIAGDNILAKFDGSGNYLWSVVFGYGTTLDTLASVVEGAGGVLGLVSWSTPNVLTMNIPLTRFDASGNFLGAWIPLSLATASEVAYSYPGITSTSDGGFVTTGESYLIKYDASGATCMGLPATPNLIFPSPTVTSPGPSVTARTPTVTSPSHTRQTPSNTQYWPCNPLELEEETSSGDTFYFRSERGRLCFTLPVAGYVQLSLYDPSGRLVARPIDGWTEAGEHEVSVETGRGVYLTLLECEGGTRIINMVR